MSDSIVKAAVKPLPQWPTYIGECCREWVLATGVLVGSCGICGDRPTYKRADS